MLRIPSRAVQFKTLGLTETTAVNVAVRLSAAFRLPYALAESSLRPPLGSQEARW